MTLKHAVDIDDVSRLDIISTKDLASWLRDLADSDLMSEDEDERTDQQEAATEAITALVSMLAGMGIRDVEADADTVARCLEDLSDRGGSELISENHWTDYVKECAFSDERPEYADQWPFTCINWEEAATELAIDYSEPELDGVTFYIRST